LKKLEGNQTRNQGGWNRAIAPALETLHWRCAPCSWFSKVLSQLWGNWKATQKEWLMKPACLLASADYGN